MTQEEIEALTEAEVPELMRREGLPVVHSMFASIHHRSERRPDGWTGGELDELADDMADGDLVRWRRELVEHFAECGYRSSEDQ